MTHLDALAVSEIVVVENVVEFFNHFAFARRTVNRGLFPSAEEGEQVLVVPQYVDVVVAQLRTVNGALNRVAAVVDDEYDRLQPIPYHSPDLLHGHL